jgi:hypothetical protein
VHPERDAHPVRTLQPGKMRHTGQHGEEVVDVRERQR